MAKRPSHPALLVLMIPVLALVIWYWYATTDWWAHERFERALRCGMTAEELRQLAADHGASLLVPLMVGRPGIPRFYISKGARVISFYFVNERLDHYRSGLSGASEGAEEIREVALCAKTTTR